jgi:rubrerythrin
MLFCFNAGEIFQLAVDIEKNGISFYREVQLATEDPEMKALFSFLESEEVEHKKRFEEFLAGLPEEQKRATVFDPDNELDLYLQTLADQHVFGKGQEIRSRVDGLKTIADALELALQCEKDSVIFYLSMQDAACEGKARDLISLLIKEEQQHMRRLASQMRRCSADAKECLLNWTR